jgi:lipoprotein-anchoring transpeptidase ErfK/SrfK
MNRTSEELEMAALQRTRNHSFHLGHALAIVGIALALAVGTFGAGAAASLGAFAIFSRSSSPQPAPTAEPVGSPVAPSPPAITPTPAPTPVPTPTPDPRHTGKVIMVSIAEQRLTAYQDGAVVLTSVVATGQPALPTPTGTFHVMSKSSPYKFVSPWPKGDQYWYPTEWVSYAMLFANEGYFLHDAPWRTMWGPGANLTHGSHGCINVPKAAMATLYSWATVETTVIVE